MKLTRAEVKAAKEMNLEVFYDESLKTYDIVNSKTYEVIAEDIPENHLSEAIKEIVASVL